MSAFHTKLKTEYDLQLFRDKKKSHIKVSSPPIVEILPAQPQF